MSRKSNCLGLTEAQIDAVKIIIHDFARTVSNDCTTAHQLARKILMHPQYGLKLDKQFAGNGTQAEQLQCLETYVNDMIGDRILTQGRFGINVGEVEIDLKNKPSIVMVIMT